MDKFKSIMPVGKAKGENIADKTSAISLVHSLSSNRQAGVRGVERYFCLVGRQG